MSEDKCGVIDAAINTIKYLHDLAGKEDVCGAVLLGEVKNPIEVCENLKHLATLREDKGGVEDENREAYLIVDSIAYPLGKDEWHDEFVDFYGDGKKWLNPRRAACSFLVGKLQAALKNPSDAGGDE